MTTYPKPTAKDETVRSKACKAFAEMLHAETSISTSSAYTWLMGQCAYGYFGNGYELAKELESDFRVDITFA